MENRPDNIKNELAYFYKVIKNMDLKDNIKMLCTPKVRQFWRGIFLWVKQEEQTKNTVQNLK